jgi:fused signal recognition particle receptor
VIFAIARRLGLPIRFIGVGESAEDLRPFVAGDFIRALFDRS